MKRIFVIFICPVLQIMAIFLVGMLIIEASFAFFMWDINYPLCYGFLRMAFIIGVGFSIAYFFSETFKDTLANGEK